MKTLKCKEGAGSFLRPRESLALLLDFYQLSMAYGYYKAKVHDKEAVFHLFFRRPPFQGGFTVACGLEAVIDYIENFHFSDDDIAYLETIKTEVGDPYFDRD